MSKGPQIAKTITVLCVVSFVFILLGNNFKGQSCLHVYWFLRMLVIKVSHDFSHYKLSDLLLYHNWPVVADDDYFVGEIYTL